MALEIHPVDRSHEYFDIRMVVQGFSQLHVECAEIILRQLADWRFHVHGIVGCLVVDDLAVRHIEDSPCHLEELVIEFRRVDFEWWSEMIDPVGLAALCRRRFSNVSRTVAPVRCTSVKSVRYRTSPNSYQFVQGSQLNKGI